MNPGDDQFQEGFIIKASWDPASAASTTAELRRWLDEQLTIWTKWTKEQTQLERAADADLRLMLQQEIQARKEYGKQVEANLRDMLQEQKQIQQTAERDQQTLLRQEIQDRKDAEKEKLQAKKDAEAEWKAWYASQMNSLTFQQQASDFMDQNPTPGGGGGAKQGNYLIGRSEASLGYLVGATGFSGGGEALRLAGNLEILTARIGNMTQSTGSFAGAIGALVPSIGIAVLAVAGITAAMSLLERAVKDTSEQIKNAIQSVPVEGGQALDVFKESVKATAASVKDQDAEMRRNIQANEERREQLRAMTDAFGKENVAVRAYDEAFIHAQANVRDEYTKLDKAIQTDVENLSKLESQKMKDAIATNAAIEAEQKLEDARLRTAQATVDEAVREGKIARTGSSTALEEQIAEAKDRERALADQIDNYNTRIQAGTAGAKDVAARDQLQAQYDAIKAQRENDEALLPIVKNREYETQLLKDLDDANKKRLATLDQEYKQLQSVNDRITQMQADRTKQTGRQAEDDQITAQRKSVEAEFAKKIQDAKDLEAERAYQDRLKKLRSDKAEQDTKAEEKYNEDVGKATDDYMKATQKAYQKFYDDNLKEQEKFQKQYIRDFQDLQFKLQNFAAERDVAGFIQAQREGQLKLDREAQDFADSQKEKHDQFQKERDDALSNYQDRLKDLQNSYQREKQDRQRQLDDRLRQEAEAHQKRVSQADQLEHQLQALRDQWQVEDENRRRSREEQDWNDRIALERQKQQEILDQISGFYQQQIGIILSLGKSAGATGIGSQINAVTQSALNIASNPVGTAASFMNMLPGLYQSYQGNVSRSTTGRQNTRGLAEFASGDNYVVGDQDVRVHHGERILTAQENTRKSSGPTVIINATVGDVATKRMIIDEVDDLASQISGIFQGATWKGN